MAEPEDVCSCMFLTTRTLRVAAVLTPLSELCWWVQDGRMPLNDYTTPVA